MKQKNSPPLISRSCSIWIKKLNARHQIDLSVDERQELERHLAACPACRARAVEYQALDALITRHLTATRPLPGLPARLQELLGVSQDTGQTVLLPSPVLQSLSSSDDTFSHRRSARLIRRLNLVAALLVVVVILGGFLILSSVYRSSNGAPPSSTILPSALYLVLNATQTTGIAYKLNASDGSVLWQQPLAHLASGSPLVAHGTFYFPASDGSIYALRSTDGQTLWHTRVATTAQGLVGSHLLAYQDLLIVSTTDGNLVALNAQTGATVWHETIPTCSLSTRSCPTYWSQENGTVYALTEEALSAWNATTGRLLWSNPHYQSNGYPQAMLVVQGKLYLTLFRNQVDVLNATNGAFLYGLQLTRSNTTFDLAANAQTLYVLGDASLAAYRLGNDARLWEHAFGAYSNGSLSANDEGVYVLFTKAFIGGTGPTPTPGSTLDFYALSAGSGTQLWHQHKTLNISSFSKPVVVNNVVCLSGLSGLYGFQASDGRQLWQRPTSPTQSLYGPVPGL